MLNYTFPTVDKVKVLLSSGPWKTRSGGQLIQRFQFPWAEIEANFFGYSNTDYQRLSDDIRGLRVYTVAGIPKGSIGAKEFHKLRVEISFTLGGVLQWTVEDVFGGRKEILLAKNEIIWIPPHILHTYQALEDNSSLLVMANTLFHSDRPATNDSYNRDEFEALNRGTPKT